MSKFVTPFPFPLEEIKAQLPKGSFFECVKWNKEQNQLEVYWEHDRFRTGRDHAIEFPSAELQVLSLPEGNDVPKFLQKLLPRLPEGVTEESSVEEGKAATTTPERPMGDDPAAVLAPSLPVATGGTPAPPQSPQSRARDGQGVSTKPVKPKAIK